MQDKSEMFKAFWGCFGQKTAEMLDGTGAADIVRAVFQEPPFYDLKA